MRQLAKKTGWFKSLSAAAAGFVLVLGAYLVIGGTATPGVVKLNPVSLSVESSGAWVEDASALSLMDRDAATAFAPAAALTRVLVTLPAETEVSALKVYGNASYDLAAYESTSGTWKKVPGLESISLKGQANAWNKFAVASPLRVRNLMLELTPAGGPAGGVKEIEIWGAEPGDAALSLVALKDAAQARALLSAAPRPGHILELAASPQSIDVPADGTARALTFTLQTEPRFVKRVYLLYDAYNADYLPVPEKRVNSGSWTGGFATATSGTPQWTSHLEEISPASLVRGQNTVEFRNTMQRPDPSSYFVRDLKVLVELENGWNLTAAVLGQSENPAHGAAAASDNDFATYFEIKSSHVLDIETAGIVQPESIKMNLWSAAGTMAGTLTLQYRLNNQWKDFTSGGTIDLSTLHDGWNEIAIPQAVSTDALRLNIHATPDRRRPGATVGGVNEIELVSSPIGTRPGRGLVVTFPNNGEFLGRTAHVQGFVHPASNGSGFAQVAVEGKPVLNADGSFSLDVTKDETRFASQADSDPWEVAVIATYPDGSKLSRIVPLTRNLSDGAPSRTESSNDAAMSGREKFTDKVAPGQAKKIQYKGVTLDIPEGAVDAETEITIIPLTEADLARLNPGMINVTYPDAGYRFLPHGLKFKKPIKISFGYAKQLFAAGQKDDEVNMYFYDEALLRWQKLARLTVDAARAQVTSESDHFTDIINSTLVVPEHPQALSFNPNSIKDIKAADPSTNVNLIEPPRANNKGTANLSYPIEIPKGRGAYTPDLRITYSSSNANGWMGLGWDIPIPSIQVDTRWGVPAYNSDKETESYLLGGQTLAPVFKLLDDPQIGRQADRRFYKRVEGDFLKIIRRGDKPTNYFWEVTDKSGVKYHYGLTPQARLADYQDPTGANNNIFQWLLEKVVDTNGNVTEFTYYKDTQALYLSALPDPGNPPRNALNGEDWLSLYLDKITYTTNTKTGATSQYSVEFVRDTGNRKDLIVNGKSGFKTAQRFRLDRVDVKFKDALIRSYKMFYIVGDFAKSLLQRITVKGVKDAEFYSHAFEYYRAGSDGIYKAFTDSYTWSTSNSGVLTKSKEEGRNRNYYEGVSFLPKRSFSTGRLTGYQSSDIQTTSKFVDVNGDGLPDMLFDSGAVHLNLGGPGGLQTFLPSGVAGLPAIEHEMRRTDSSGKANYLGLGSHTEDLAITASKSCATMSDLNGDGLVDVAYGTGAYFNHINTAGKNEFVKVDNWAYSSSADLRSIENYRKEHFHLVDPVRKWTAPFSGDIAITGAIQRKKREDAKQITDPEGDGLTLYVYRENTEIGKLTIAAEDYASHELGELASNGTDTITLAGIQQGERIYFRMNSIDNGENDEIVFDPVITYTASGGRDASSLQTLKDVNGRPMYVYSGASDFSLADKAVIIWGAQHTGRFVLIGTITKQKTNDDVRITIKRSRNVEYDVWDGTVASYTLAANEERTIDLSELVSTAEGERFVFLVESDSAAVDASRVTFKAEAVFTEVETCEMAEDWSEYTCTMTPVSDPDTKDPWGNYLYRFAPPVNYPIVYMVPKAGSTTWVAPYDGVVDIAGTVTRTNATSAFVARITGINKSIWKLSVPAGGSSGDPEIYSHNVTSICISKGDQLFFEIQSEGPLNNDVSWSPEVHYKKYCGPHPVTGQNGCWEETCNYDESGNATDCSLLGLNYIFNPGVQYYYEDPEEDQEPFGGGFRQWHYGEWNGNNQWDQSRIRIPDPNDMSSTAVEDFTRMLPEPGGTPHSGGQSAWTSMEERSFIVAGGLSSSRLAEGSMAGSCLGGGILRHSTGTNQNVSGTFFVGGTNRSHGNTATQIELLDMNGDRYPDLVTPDRVVLSDGKTGLKSDGTAPGGFRTNYNDNTGYNLSIGATVNAISSAAKTLTTSSTSSGSGGSNILQYIAISAAYVRGRSSTKSDLIDVNGDGLPDLVYQGNPLLLMLEGVPSITVRLNLGNRFGAEEQWYLPGDSKIRDAANKTLSINLGLDLFGYIGTSRGLSVGVQKNERDMVDINGDGLPDMVSKKSEDDYITVRINQGGSFGNEEYWPIPSWRMSPPQRRGELQIWSTLFGMRGTSEFLDEILFENDTLTNLTTESDTHGWFANGALPAFNKKHPWKNLMWRIKGKDAARTNVHVKSQIDFTDIDGDGLPDHIMKANTYYDIEVKRNLSGKANLLKTVRRPLGGKFTLEYTRKGNKVDYSNPTSIIDMPYSYWVLSKVKLNDGMKKSDGKPKHVYETAYTYDSGYYSRAEREFYGFKTVAETRGKDGDTVTVVQTYHNQDYYTKGLLASSVTKDGADRAWVATANDHNVRPESVSESGFPHLTKTTTSYYDLANQAVAKSTMQEYLDYDRYGNVLEYADRGDEGANDDVIASIRYDQSNETEYIVNKPRSIEVKDSGGRIYRSRSASYYPGTGNLRSLSMLVRQGMNADWAFDYHDDGNLSKITYPAGDPAYNTQPGGYFLTYGYDPEVSTYVASITDALGYASSADYDYRFGQPTVQKDINGHYQVNGYDDNGRLSRIYGPYAVNPATGAPVCAPTIAFEYTDPAFDPSASSLADNLLNSPALAVTTNRADSFRGCTAATIKTATFGDGLKRIIQTKKDASINGSAGVVVSGAMVFDSLGRVSEQGQPVPGASLEVYQDLTATNPTIFAYDTLDRTTEVLTPDANGSITIGPVKYAKTSTVYGFGVPPQGGGAMFKTTVYDPNNYLSNPRTGKGIKISYKDSHDRIVAVQEHQKGGYISTKYYYNALGEITSVIDAKNNTTAITYDLLGRRLTIDNPDTGLTAYTYDANGNVTTKQTPNLKARGTAGGNVVSYIYEYNRLAKIDYPESIDVQYVYGDPTDAGDAKANLAGRIKQVTDESGTEWREYGRLGETVRELKQINASNNPVARTKYDTRYVFDTFGRMTELTYPDGEVLYYVYDKGGLLKEAYGLKRQNRYVYIKNLLYDEFGQRTKIEYGNGVTTDYAYDPLSRRLSRLATIENAKKRTIQAIDYTYDLVGNILDIVNTALIPQGGEIGGPTQHHFTYDDLYQFTTANGFHLPAPGKKTQYTNDFSYDIIGNIMSKLQTHLIVGTSSSQEPRETNYNFDYKYNGPQPHAVRDAGDKLYTYDQNGNMKGWASKTTNATRTIVWNEENRVKQVIDSGNGTSFLYDDSGERVVKGGGGNETVYLNRFYSLKNGDLGSKHIFAGETRICTKLEKDGGSITSGVPGVQGITNGNVLFAYDRGPGRQIGISRRLPPSSGGTGGTGTAVNPPIEKFMYFYHGDHLGSSSFITDDLGQVYQELEYFPYGETWVEDGGSGQMPYYRFTGKELDPETGLYYYGARYYDPVLSRWISADPILAKYLPTINEKRKAGLGGVFNPKNLALYTYSQSNPIILSDPNGKETYVGIRDLAVSPIGVHSFNIIVTDDPSKYGKYSERFKTYTNTTGNFPGVEKGKTFYAAILGTEERGGKIVKYSFEGNAGDRVAMTETLKGTNWYKADYDLTFQKLEPIEGLDQTQMEIFMFEQFDSYNNEANYGKFATGQDANCHVFTSTLSERSGVKNVPNDLPGVDPGTGKRLPGVNFVETTSPTGGSNIVQPRRGERQCSVCTY